jgi:hypothetical protein
MAAAPTLLLAPSSLMLLQRLPHAGSGCPAAWWWWAPLCGDAKRWRETLICVPQRLRRKMGRRFAYSVGVCFLPLKYCAGGILGMGLLMPSLLETV